jgi:hypothetical protein
MKFALNWENSKQEEGIADPFSRSRIRGSSVPAQRRTIHESGFGKGSNNYLIALNG